MLNSVELNVRQAIGFSLAFMTPSTVINIKAGWALLGTYTLFGVISSTVVGIFGCVSTPPTWLHGPMPPTGSETPV